MTKFLVVDPTYIMSESDWDHTADLSDQRCDEAYEAQMTDIEKTRYEFACMDATFRDFFKKLSPNVTVGSIFSNYLAYLTAVKNVTKAIQIDGSTFCLHNNYLIAELTPALRTYIEQAGPKTALLLKLNLPDNHTTSLTKLIQSGYAQVLTVPGNQTAFKLTIPADGDTLTWDPEDDADQLIPDAQLTIQCA